MSRAVSILCAAGGAAGIAYEVAWLHGLSLAVGSSTRALALVLAFFLAGMALGGWLGGRLLSTRRPLRTCGLLVLLIGGAGLVAPAALGTLPSWLRALVGAGLDLEPARVLVCLVLLPPTLLMGATYPLWVRALVACDAGSSGVGRRAAQVCALQVFGAAAGAGLSGFVIIPAVGFSAASQLAGAVDLIAGCIMIFLGARQEEEAASGPGAGEAPAGRLGLRVGLAFVLAGSASLGLQTLWTRALVFFLDGLHFAFSAVLTAFLLGLGLGGGLVAMVAPRIRRPEAWLAVLLLLAGAAGLGTLLLAPWLGAPAAALLGGGDGFRGRMFFLALGFLILPATLLGALLPLASWIAARGGGSLGGSLGRAYGLTTCGNALGATLTPLLLVPWLGLREAWAAMAVLQGVAAALLARGWRTRVCAVALVALAAWCLQAVASDDRPLVLASHIFSGSRGPDHRLEVSVDGEACSVSVVANDRFGNRVLYTDTFAAAATGREYPYMRLLGHLPVLLCEHPERVLVLCFGTGTTAGAVAAHAEVGHLRVVDVEREVFRAAAWFKDVNGDVLAGRAGLDLQTVVRDGRLDLVIEPGKHDVITLEPLLPYTQGAVHFYTREFYALARSRLTQGGVLCQWLPIHALPVADYRMLVKTFLDVFPEGQLYFFEQSSLLVGRNGGSPSTFADLAARATAPRVARSLEEALVAGPEDLLAGRVGGGAALAGLLQGDPVMLDDHPTVMFLARRVSDLGPQRDTLAFLETLADAQAARARAREDGVRDLDGATYARIRLLAATRRKLLHARWREAAWMTATLPDSERGSLGLDPVLQALQEALLTAPGHLEGLRLLERRQHLLARVLARNALRAGRPQQACLALLALPEGAEPDVRERTLLGEVLVVLGDAAEAARVLDAALARHPRDVRSLVARSLAAPPAGDPGAGRRLKERALSLDPEGARRALENLAAWRAAARDAGLPSLGTVRAALEADLTDGLLDGPERVVAARERFARSCPRALHTALAGTYLRTLAAGGRRAALARRAVAVLGIRAARSLLAEQAANAGRAAREARRALASLVPDDTSLLQGLWTSPDVVTRRLLAWFAAERGTGTMAAAYLPGLLDADADVRLATDRALRVLTGKNANYDYTAPGPERRRKHDAWSRLLR